MDPVSIFFSCVGCLCTQNCLYVGLSHQCNYLRRRREKVKGLEKKMEELRNRTTDKKRKLDVAYEQEGKKPTNEVVQWLKDVEEIEKEVHSLMEEVREEPKCFNGCFPNYYSRLKLGKNIVEKTTMVTELLERGQFSDDQLTYLPQEKGKTFLDIKLLGKTTAEGNFEKIWECIMDKSIQKVGIYGMGGVGKTTVMKDIHNRLLKNTRFDTVIWITLSKDSDLEKLQNDIAKELKLNFSNKDEKNMARELFAALTRKNRFILILDDMWKAFPLENVGIPNPTRENGCKLVLTTRLQGVCRGMETQKNVEITVLSDEEAWVLFKGIVGEDVLRSSSDIQALAKDVAKECDGLPVALVTVGRALRQVYDVMDWKNALNELRTSRASKSLGLEDVVFKSLRYSFTRLRDDKIKACFLYCALYPEDYEIEVGELIEHWIGEGLINSNLSRDEQICKGKCILNELKSACMLENADDNWIQECVKMHDLLRDLAIRNQSCIIKARFGLRKAPGDEEWIENLERVSLIGNDIERLTGEPKCPNLFSLLLQRNPLRDISHPFFQHMLNLRVINLSYTNIEFLPKSLLDLKNLRALFLSECKKLRELPSLSNLKSLGTLDLSNSTITELPPGMEMLVNVRRLDLWNCKLKMFPAKLIQKLTLLEELSVVGESFRWGSDAVEEAEGGACVEELLNDKQLRILEVHFFCSENFSSYIKSGHWRQLTTFRFSMGKQFDRINPSKFGKCISIRGIEFNVGGKWLVLPDTIHELEMRDCDTLTRLSMCLPKLPQLKKCLIQDCKNMECIVMAGENNLPSLPIMNLRYLAKLSRICKGVVAPGTLSSLKCLVVFKCNNLRNLLTIRLLQNLQSLEEISVYDCDQLEEIVGQGDDEDKEEGEEIISSNNNGNSIITLRRLQKLWLYSLRELKSLCPGVMVCNSLHSIEVKYCEKLKKLPIIDMEIDQTSPPPAIRKIIGNRKWWDPLRCDHPDIDIFVQPFEEWELEYDWAKPLVI